MPQWYRQASPRACTASAATTRHDRRPRRRPVPTLPSQAPQASGGEELRTEAVCVPAKYVRTLRAAWLRQPTLPPIPCACPESRLAHSRHLCCVGKSDFDSEAARRLAQVVCERLPRCELPDGPLAATEHVPYASAKRYKESALRKRAQREQVWELKRREDKQVKTEDSVPPKFVSADFQHASYWSHRGGLDIPRERFIFYPDVVVAGKGLLLGWSGLNEADLAAIGPRAPPVASPERIPDSLLSRHQHAETDPLDPAVGGSPRIRAEAWPNCPSN
ncbi:DUF7008 domain-containing protein [Streptomyces sulphureus]|uniref:DUF7008 domain-containing protein n=1 Tax=Streptomyces sulphureus TaxID=47758 RepID=UPI003CCC3379